MYWQEDNRQSQYVVPDDVVDVSFAMRCTTLPVEHAYALAEAVLVVLPWLTGEEGAGIHPIHVADSGNGWMRPEGPDDLLYPSRRTKLVLRVARARIEDSKRLAGETLDIAGHALTVGQPAVRKLSDHGTVFSRYVVSEGDANEEAFMARVNTALNAMGIRAQKMLPGIEKLIQTPHGHLHTRSLMLADLSVEESVRLQQLGLGPKRLLGCGLFIPHKSIQEVGAAAS